MDLDAQLALMAATIYGAMYQDSDTDDICEERMRRSIREATKLWPCCSR